MDFNKIHKILNENILPTGYSKSTICELIVNEFNDLRLDLVYKMGFVVTSDSMITYPDGKSESIDKFVYRLIQKNIIEVRKIGFKDKMIRRFFTTDYEKYQKLNKRKKIIDKILKGIN